MEGWELPGPQEARGGGETAIQGTIESSLRGRMLTCGRFLFTARKCTGFPEPACVLGAGFRLEPSQKVWLMKILFVC